jgi:hypothetical protein
MGRKTATEMIADWFREASVLVAVFAWLDKRVQGEAFSGEWALESGAMATLFFVIGAVVERLWPTGYD